MSSVVPRGGRWGGEGGFAAGGEALAFGVLVFVIGTLLVVNAWGVVDAKVAASAAAREAARVVVEAPAGATVGAARSAAGDAATTVLEGHGKDPARLRDVEVEVGAAGDDQVLARCQRVVVRVSYAVPSIALPWVGGLGDGFTVTGSHSEVVDPFRSGLAGEADCDF